MKKILVVAALLSVSLMGCNSNNSSNGGGNTNYTNTNLENDIITFLNSRGITSITKIEPLHYIDDSDVDSAEFNEETEDTFANYSARVSSSDIENEILDSFENYGWTVFYDSEYELYCATDPNELAEIDVEYLTGTYLGTWITVYSYEDLYGEGGGGELDYVDIGSATSVTFADLDLENGEQYTCFSGDNIEIYFGDGENDGKYYDTGEAIRIYPDGYVAIYSATSQNIKKIEFTWGPSGYPDTDKYEINAGTYNVSTQIWSGDSEGVILTKVGNSPKHLRLEAISVTLG